MRGEHIRQFVRATFDEVPERSHGDELVFICPEPGCRDRSGNRSVNLSSGLTSCWVCNKGGPFVAWARRLGHVIDDEGMAVGALDADEIGAMLEKIDDVGTTAVASGYVPEVKLPRGFVAVSQEPQSAYAKLIAQMAVRKRLDLADLVEAGVGFTRESRRWEPFAIFPTFEWGRPVYYQGRTYVDTPGESTKQFPTREECPVSSKYWVYNIDEARARGGVLVVVESILNVLSLRRELRRRGITDPIVPIAVFKHKVSDPQYVKLTQLIRQAAARKHPVTEVCFIYDSDATATAFKDAEMFVNTIPVSVVEMPEGVDANDDAVEAVDRFLRRRPFSPLDRLQITLK